MKKVTAKAPANIAFIKYWGKKDEKLRLPANSSISMNLSGACTTTSVEFDKRLAKDEFFIDGESLAVEERDRLSKHLDLIRKKAGLRVFAEVRSKNNFPKGVGIASSASGFAALTMAAAKAAGLGLSEKELSILARLGSGSACRSIPDGFVEWRTGKRSKDSYAYSLFPPEYWDICDLIAVVGEKEKKVSSTEGHALAQSSPFYRARIIGIPKKIREIKKALKDKDFTKFGEVSEREAINMHAVMMTSNPPLYYWSPQTQAVILAVEEWRDSGLEVYFTIDAGPSVHLICKSNGIAKVRKCLSGIMGIKRVIINYPAAGARFLTNGNN